jgi:hypothetical protein
MGTVTTIGVDIAKSVFQLHGVDKSRIRREARAREKQSSGNGGESEKCLPPKGQ